MLVTCVRWVLRSAIRQVRARRSQGLVARVRRPALLSATAPASGAPMTRLQDETLPADRRAHLVAAERRVEAEGAASASAGCREAYPQNPRPLRRRLRSA